MKNSSIKCALTKLHNSGKWFRICDYSFFVYSIFDGKYETIYQVIDENENNTFIKFWNNDPIIFTIERNFFRKSTDKIVIRESRQYHNISNALQHIFLVCKCFREA